MGAAGAPARLALLSSAPIELAGRMPWSSNATFLANLHDEPGGPILGQAIYKPTRGERPLWDFPAGLHRRELAAYRLSEHLGLGLVPETVVRDGPLGEGSLQWCVPADHRQHYFTIYEERPELHDRLRAVALFDLLTNNTDRKSGHVLTNDAGEVWAIDHGLCFAAEFKLRTVIWEFAGDQIDGSLLGAVRRLAGSVPLDIAALLDDDEVAALRERAAEVAELAVFPADPTGRRYPWPLV